LTEFGDVEPVVPVVLVEIIILKILHKECLIGQHQMGDQEGLESVIQIWDHPEILEWDECDELHVLNHGPHRNQPNILP
jgi:hypothetical protein